MAAKEKAHLKGGPIPNCVVADGSESSPITISLQGAPQGKGRARAFVRGDRIGHYTPEKTRTYEGMIRTAAMDAIGDRPVFDEPVEFVLRAVFAVPASWSKRKQQQAIVGEIKPAKKPDLDNIAKAWNDALNGVVYRDDALIVRQVLEKRYGPQPLVVCTVRLIAAAHRAQADALEIEAGAKRRLADEYDAAQERGEVQRRGGDETSKAEVPTVTDIGLADEYDAAQERGEIRSNGERSFSSPEKVGSDELNIAPKDIHEARIIRDAEVPRGLAAEAQR